MNIGANIKKRREALNMSQAELAEKVNVSGAMMCQIERGSKNPSVSLCLELAKLFECEITDLL